MSRRMDVAPVSGGSPRTGSAQPRAERSFPATPCALPTFHAGILLASPTRMTSPMPIADGPVLPALATRALADGALRLACSLLLVPLSALASEASLSISPGWDVDGDEPHPTPVVFVHGFLGH